MNSGSPFVRVRGLWGGFPQGLRTSFRKGMKIVERLDGKVWVFRENMKGWIYLSQSGIDPGQALSVLVEGEMDEQKSLTYGQALTVVQKKYPQLTKQYLDHVRGKRG